MIEDGDVAPWIQRGSVMVAAGLVALEGIAAGSRVVMASRESGGSLVDVVTPGTWSAALRSNFLGIGGPIIEPAEAWRRLDRLTDADRVELSALLRRDASPTAALDVILALGEGEGRPAGSNAEPDSLAVAAARCWVDAEARFEDLRGWLPKVEEARDYYRTRAEHFERMASKSSGRAE